MKHSRRMGIVVLMVFLSVMTYIDRIIISIAGPGIIKDFSLSETQMGTIYSAYLFSYTIMMIPGGYLADRFGPRLTLTFMALGSALFTGLTALGGSPGLGTYIGIVPSFLMIRMCMGICAAPMGFSMLPRIASVPMAHAPTSGTETSSFRSSQARRFATSAAL